jgi:hypothetical protein
VLFTCLNRVPGTVHNNNLFKLYCLVAYDVGMFEALFCLNFLNFGLSYLYYNLALMSANSTSCSCQDSSGTEFESLPPLRTVSSSFFVAPTAGTPPIAPSAENPLNITQTGDRTPAGGHACNLPLSLSRPDPNNVINTMVKMAACPKKNDVMVANDVTVVNNDVVAANSDVVVADSFYMSISEGRLSSSSSDVSSSSRSSERLSRRASMKKNEKILQVSKQECHCPYKDNRYLYTV